METYEIALPIDLLFLIHNSFNECIPGSRREMRNTKKKQKEASAPCGHLSKDLEATSLHLHPNTASMQPLFPKRHLETHESPGMALTQLAFISVLLRRNCLESSLDDSAKEWIVRSIALLVSRALVPSDSYRIPLCPRPSESSYGHPCWSE